MQRNISNQAIFVIAACTMARAAGAEVMDATANGFTIRYQVTIAAERAAVYKAAVEDIGKWWSAEHTISGNAKNLYVHTTVPGCFCETLGEHAAIQHLAVSFVNPGVIIRLSGGLGPLGLLGVNGNMTWEFEDANPGTSFVLQYAVGGYLDGGLDAIAGAVDGVLVEAVTRLKSYAETGSPD